jgi:plasmid maintenance system antidote protein VapI
MEFTMSYLETIANALHGKSVNATAKAWGLPQSSLDRFVRGERLPSFAIALKIADEAGIPHGEMLEILAQEEERRKKTSYNIDRADVAQSVEQLIRNQ